MGRFVVLHQKGDRTALVVDRELLTVTVEPCEVLGEHEPSGDLEVVPVGEPTQISSRMFYHQGTSPQSAP